jgi:hypothetical protein
MIACAERVASSMKRNTAGLQLRNGIWKQVRAMQRQSRAHARIISAEFFAEIEPLLQIRLAAGEFAADRKIAAPRTPAARHRDLHLLRFGQREELAAGLV